MNEDDEVRDDEELEELRGGVEKGKKMIRILGKKIEKLRIWEDVDEEDRIIEKDKIRLGRKNIEN